MYLSVTLCTSESIRVFHYVCEFKNNHITLPRSKGGFGIIDLVDQSRALLSKMLIRGFTLGQEIWKVLLLDRCSNCSPRLGAPR